MAEKRNTRKPRRLDENFWNQRGALRIGDDMPLYMLLPIIIFSAVVILIVRMHTYNRNMDQFYWSSAGNDVTDFFSYYKMVLIVVCAVIALVFILLRYSLQTFFVRRCLFYIPMCVYTLFVLFSYLICDYKEFSLWGYNDRFEGTIPLISYMIMLFFIINTVNSERNVKQILYPIAAASTLLSFLGLSQALDHDFFRTTFGKQLITPSWFWENVDSLNFTFQDKEIYQTVYNINYVSFYLTLLIPLFAMIFIRSFMKGKEEAVWKKIMWAALFFLLVYNLIGSASSGGLLGMFFVVLAAVIVLNKRLIHWWKPALILIVIAGLVFGITSSRWLPEISHTLKGALTQSSDTVPSETTPSPEDKNVTPGAIKPYIDYFNTEGSTITTSLNGNPISFTLIESSASDEPFKVDIRDEEDNAISLKETDTNGYFAIDDDRFRNYCTMAYTVDEDGQFYLLLTTAEQTWPFTLQDGEVYYVNQLGKPIKLSPVESIGFKNSDGFGSGRGYIWSRSLPMMKKTAILGYGPDTYCVYYPHYDYAGKYNSQTFSSNINIIVDKPHCLYMGMWIGCGGAATLAFIALLIMYIIQSVKTFRKRDYFVKDVNKRDTSFLAFAGSGIFFGIIGFAISAAVDDSTVSVMPLFYGLLGTGIVINSILMKNASLPVPSASAASNQTTTGSGKITATETKTQQSSAVLDAQSDTRDLQESSPQTELYEHTAADPLRESVKNIQEIPVPAKAKSKKSKKNEKKKK